MDRVFLLILGSKADNVIISITIGLTLADCEWFLSEDTFIRILPLLQGTLDLSTIMKNSSRGCYAVEADLSQIEIYERWRS